MENIKEGFINPYGFIPLGEKRVRSIQKMIWYILG